MGSEYSDEKMPCKTIGSELGDFIRGIAFRSYGAPLRIQLFTPSGPSRCADIDSDINSLIGDVNEPLSSCHFPHFNIRDDKYLFNFFLVS